MILERHTDGSLWAGDVKLMTHAESGDCLGGCVVHHPSPSHMSDWPLNWRSDRGMMERMCPCGTGHPDPDQVKYWIRTLKWQDAWAEMVHGCCGHCATEEEN